MRSRLLACAVGLLAGPSAAQSELWFTEYEFNAPTLQRMDLVSLVVVDAFGPANPFPVADWLPVGLALDPGAGRVYWTHGSFNAGRIQRASLDGSGQTLLASGLKLPRGVSLDTAAGKMYWANSPAAGNAGGLIERANLDGTARETVFAITPYDPVASKIGRPTVDAANGWVWFGADDALVRASLDPPFESFVVARGASTPTRIALDLAQGHVYWIDSDTISDCVARVDLDGSGFAVVVDSTPGSVESSGLIDLAIDRAAGKLYWADEIGQDVIQRASLDGSGLETVYTSPGGKSPSGLAFDLDPPQPVLDCNGNGVRDRDDVLSGTSADCNQNAIPDECERLPCVTPAWLVDHGLDTDATMRALGGTTPGTGWEVFQRVDVPAGGWHVGTAELNGRTNSYHPSGFTVRVHPDDGADYPDETQTLATGSGLFRFGETWIAVELDVVLPAGRHWLHVSANGTYQAGLFTAPSGLASFSRSNLGNDFPAGPVALRLAPGEPGTPLCSGDGSGAACPCGNTSPSAGSGCRHSGGAGIVVVGGGSTSIAADDLELTAHQCPLGNTGIFYCGRSSLAPGNPLYDGLQCAAGDVRRFAPRFQTDGVVSDRGFVAQDPSGVYFVPGVVYVFQYWSRDVAAGASPCGLGANFSNGYAVTTTP